jgi:general secretion pathway protein I
LDVTTIAAVLYKIKVIVSWGDDAKAGGREVELITLKLANKTV